MSRATIVKYQDTALPQNGTPVTLFNSITAFPPGSNLPFLGQKWFAFTITANAGTTNTVTAESSTAGRATVAGSWRVIYSSGNLDFTTGPKTFRAEIYIADLQDVRILFNPSANQTVFEATLALLPEKASTAVASTDTVGGQAYPIVDT